MSVRNDIAENIVNVFRGSRIFIDSSFVDYLFSLWINDVVLTTWNALKPQPNYIWMLSVFKCWPILVFVHHTILIICITCRKFRIHVRYKNFKQCVFSLTYFDVHMIVWAATIHDGTFKVRCNGSTSGTVNYFLPENNGFFLYWHLHNSRSSQVFHVLCFPHDSMHCMSRSHT